MYTLYGSRGSGSAAIEAALAIAGLPHRRVRASSWEPETLDELQRVNPLAQIPTLVLPSGAVMTESAAILIHLGLVAPASGLLPENAEARAQALRGLVYVAANCYAAVGIVDHPERWTTASTRPAQDKLRAGARLRLHRYWEIFADQFAGEPFLGGAQPGALDLLAAAVSRWAGTRAHLKRHRPQLLQTLQRTEQHALVAPVWRAHFGAA